MTQQTTLSQRIRQQLNQPAKSFQWTQQSDEIIWQHYRTHSDQELADLIGNTNSITCRSVGSIDNCKAQAGKIIYNSATIYR
ncbi:MAG: hypothetical protein KatS3mg031_0178 [Chitinophagales bacterium]|nr:MAG: hypothetical protein KatS3mg031_0178 [Chitinophagales bacterium]